MEMINWIIYGGLFFTFFIKITDEKDRFLCRKIAYLSLMLCSLFLSVTAFKTTFINGYKTHLKFDTIQTIFNAFVLILMLTKVREDKIFKRK